MKYKLFILRTAFLVLSAVLISGCSIKFTIAPPFKSAGHVERGIASWYGPGFYGKKTASGEVYTGRDLTAAHKTLPFGSRVLVRRLDTGKSVVVRINDRGPFIKGRIIDLSKRSAEKIGLEGITEVEIRVIK